MTEHEHKDCDTTQPVANWKCIWFTLALAGGYWYLPPKNKWVLLGVALLPLYRACLVRSLVSVPAEPRTYLPGFVLLVGQAQGQ